MFRKTIGVTVVMLAVAVWVPALVTSAPSGAASRKYTIAYVAGEPLNGQREAAMVRGGRAAAKALGVRYIAAEFEFDTEGLIRSLIARHVDAIATEVYDPALKPILAKVRAAGIVLLSSATTLPPSGASGSTSRTPSPMARRWPMRWLADGAQGCEYAQSSGSRDSFRSPTNGSGW